MLGTFRDEPNASWCTVCVGCAGVPAATAVDAGPGSHGHMMWAMKTLQRQKQEDCSMSEPPSLRMNGRQLCDNHTEAGCDRRPPVSLMSARQGLSLLAIALLLLLAHDSGTVYLLTSSLPHHSQHFARSRKRIYFGSRTQTLSFSCVAIVDLEVTLT